MARVETRAIVGAALVIAGCVSGVLSFGYLDWYDVPARADTASDITFSALRHSADQLHGTGIARVYFGGVVLPLLIVLVASGVLANGPLGPTAALRVVGFTVGLVGVVLTYLAITQLHNAQVAAGAPAHSVFYNSTWGLWLMLGGFAAAAIGSVIGTRTSWTT